MICDKNNHQLFIIAFLEKFTSFIFKYAVKIKNTLHIHCMYSLANTGIHHMRINTIDDHELNPGNLKSCRCGYVSKSYQLHKN
jgi:hypothetical protein